MPKSVFKHRDRDGAFGADLNMAEKSMLIQANAPRDVCIYTAWCVFCSASKNGQPCAVRQLRLSARAFSGEYLFYGQNVCGMV